MGQFFVVEGNYIQKKGITEDAKKERKKRLFRRNARAGEGVIADCLKDSERLEKGGKRGVGRLGESR